MDKKGGRPLFSVVANVVGCLVGCGSKFRVADLAAEDGGAESEAGGGEGNDEYKPGAPADPVGPPA